MKKVRSAVITAIIFLVGFVSSAFSAVDMFLQQREGKTVQSENDINKGKIENLETVVSEDMQGKIDDLEGIRLKNTNLETVDNPTIESVENKLKLDDLSWDR